MTKRPWQAEIEVTPETVRLVVNEQLPHLASHDITFLGYGWDNDAYLVGNHIFRFPRRQIAVEMVEFEAAILRLLPNTLPLEVPRLEQVGRPSGAYPHSFLVYQMVKGTSACDLPQAYRLSAQDASTLGQFLRQIHAIPATVSDTIRGDTMRKGDIPFRLGKIEAAIAALPGDALPAGKDEVLQAARILARATSADKLTLVHGDLYARHVLVDSRRVTGVIDWGDAHVGDPALDLSIAYTMLNAETAATFFLAYGIEDERTQKRAMFRALFYSAVLADFGIGNQDESILAIGRFATRRVLESL
ncbi:MAG: phosphotransferase [Armatimonadetes bacterium]|nr:phosphotransferase [Armatimonadota bacterium]